MHFQNKKRMWSYCVLMPYFILIIISLLSINLDTVLFKIIFLLTGWWSWDMIHLSQLMWLQLASSTQLSALIRDYYHHASWLPQLNMITTKVMTPPVIGPYPVIAYTSKNALLSHPWSWNHLDRSSRPQYSLQRWLEPSIETALQLDVFLLFNFLFPHPWLMTPEHSLASSLVSASESASERSQPMTSKFHIFSLFLGQTFILGSIEITLHCAYSLKIFMMFHYIIYIHTHTRIKWCINVNRNKRKSVRGTKIKQLQIGMSLFTCLSAWYKCVSFNKRGTEIDFQTNTYMRALRSFWLLLRNTIFALSKVQK